MTVSFVSLIALALRRVLLILILLGRFSHRGVLVLDRHQLNRFIFLLTIDSGLILFLERFLNDIVPLVLEQVFQLG